MKKILLTLLGLLSFVYILNPFAGIFEILPDALPFIGNLDEVTATYFIMLALKEYDIDLTRLIAKKNEVSGRE